MLSASIVKLPQQQTFAGTPTDFKNSVTQIQSSILTRVRYKPRFYCTLKLSLFRKRIFTADLWSLCIFYSFEWDLFRVVLTTCGVVSQIVFQFPTATVVQRQVYTFFFRNILIIWDLEQKKNSHSPTDIALSAYRSNGSVFCGRLWLVTLDVYKIYDSPKNRFRIQKGKKC